MRPLIRVEQLESRDVPAAFGQPWADARHLTLSLAPDSTNIAGVPSTLFATLGAARPAADWQASLFRAVQAWSAVGNVSIGIVADGGQAFGTAGPVQGDRRFGDIRIGARPLAPSVLAVAVPPDAFLSGTWAGDITLNSAVDWSDPRNDLDSVLLHEVGHALGLDENDDACSAMCRDLSLAPSALSARDVAAFRALYGARPADANEGVPGNDTPATATALPAGSGRIPLVEFGDITGSSDLDYFTFVAPTAASGSMNVDVVSHGVSLFAPRVCVFDESGNLLATGASATLGGDRVTVTVPQVRFGTRYYVRVEGAAGDYATGRYGAGVTFPALDRVPDDRLFTVLTGPNENLTASALGDLFDHPDGGGSPLDHATTQRAIELKTQAGFASRTLFTASGDLKGASGTVVYTFESPRRVNGQPLVLTAGVTADAGGAIPQVLLLDEAGRVVAVDVLASDSGRLTIQAVGVDPDETYFLKVTFPTGGGQYRLIADFTRTADLMGTLASGRVTPTAAVGGQLYVGQPQLFHLSLAVDPAPSQPGASVRVTILDATGNVAWSVTVAAGGTLSDTGVLLAPGAYRVVIETVGATEPLTFRFRGAVLGDPIGPVVDNPTATPLYQTTGKPGSFTYPNGLTCGIPFLWVFWVI